MAIIPDDCPNSLVVKHVLGKDESQVRFLLRAPEIFHLLCVCLFLFQVVYVQYTPITKTAQYAVSEIFLAPCGHNFPSTLRLFVFVSGRDIFPKHFYIGCRGDACYYL